MYLMFSVFANILFSSYKKRWICLIRKPFHQRKLTFSSSLLRDGWCGA